MTEPLYVHTDVVTSLSAIHERVAEAMSRLVGSTPDMAALETAYGTISAAFTAALGEALPHRDARLADTKAASQSLAEMLREAATRYERVDEDETARLAPAAAPAVPAAPAGGAGTEPGQQINQVGQQVGQLVQGVAQVVQGVAQGLTQLPQQVAQGLHGVMDSATGGEHDDDAKRLQEKDSEDSSQERSDEESREPRMPPTHPEGAQPGHGAGAGAAPVPPPPPIDRPQPAQTRPQ